MRQPPRIQLGARFERLDPPGLALEVLVGAVEKKGDKGANLVAQGGLGGREGWLGDEFVVLFVFPAPGIESARGEVWIAERGHYADGLEDRRQTGKVMHARAESCDGGLEEGEGGAQGGDAVRVGRGGVPGGHCCCSMWVSLSVGLAVGVYGARAVGWWVGVEGGFQR